MEAAFIGFLILEICSGHLLPEGEGRGPRFPALIRTPVLSRNTFGALAEQYLRRIAYQRTSSETCNRENANSVVDYPSGFRRRLASHGRCYRSHLFIGNNFGWAGKLHPKPDAG